jgi:hypothetical protein
VRALSVQLQLQIFRVSLEEVLSFVYIGARYVRLRVEAQQPIDPPFSTKPYVMDDPVGGRGFALSHQRVVLDIDFSGVITATAHLTIHPTGPGLRTIYLHASPLLQLSSVTLSSPVASDPLLPTPASYALTQPFLPLPARDPPLDIKSHPEIKRKTWAAAGEKDDGELAISVSGGWVRLVHGEDG